ncbi:hypothetical protein [Acetobacter papayae]|uniref:hypothetical protein n=1 Tax=Acetobacter papayae TaxID=1076592 RepID=UPI001F221294|nr:hypothetical protein [Acetobacter papayae]
MTAPQPPIAQPHHASHPARHTPPRPRFSHRPLRHAAITLLAGLLAASTLPAYADTPPPRMVTDMGGAVVSIPQDNGPIADLWYAHNEITVMLGGAGRIAVSAESPTESPCCSVSFPPCYKPTRVSAPIPPARKTCWPAISPLCSFHRAPRRRNCAARACLPEC